MGLLVSVLGGLGEIQMFVRLVPGQGASVCDELQCLCDRAAAGCMAAASFNHSLAPRQCGGPAPSCRRASWPPKLLPPQSSEEEQEGDSDGAAALDVSR